MRRSGAATSPGGFHVGAGSMARKSASETKPKKATSVFSSIFGRRTDPVKQKQLSPAVRRRNPSVGSSAGATPQAGPAVGGGGDGPATITSSPSRRVGSPEGQSIVMRALGPLLRTASLKRPMASGMLLKGLGLQLSYDERNEMCLISDVTENSPAAKTELLFVDDALVEINGTFVLDLSLDKVIMILATVGHEVVLRVSTIESASSALTRARRETQSGSEPGIPDDTGRKKQLLYDSAFWSNAPTDSPITARLAASNADKSPTLLEMADHAGDERHEDVSLDMLASDLSNDATDDLNISGIEQFGNVSSATNQDGSSDVSQELDLSGISLLGAEADDEGEASSLAASSPDSGGAVNLPSSGGMNLPSPRGINRPASSGMNLPAAARIGRRIVGASFDEGSGTSGVAPPTQETAVAPLSPADEPMLEGASSTKVGDTDYGFFVKLPPKRAARRPSATLSDGGKGKGFLTRVFSSSSEPSNPVKTFAHPPDDVFIDERRISRDIISMKGSGPSKPAGLRRRGDRPSSVSSEPPRLTLEDQVRVAMGDETSKVLSFLQSIGLEKYIEIFTEEEIDMETLPSLNDSDLEKMGIKTVGARKKIMRGITQQMASQWQGSPDSSERSYHAGSVPISFRHSARSVSGMSVASSVPMTPSEHSAFSAVTDDPRDGLLS